MVKLSNKVLLSSQYFKLFRSENKLTTQYVSVPKVQVCQLLFFFQGATNSPCWINQQIELTGSWGILQFVVLSSQDKLLS